MRKLDRGQRGMFPGEIIHQHGDTGDLIVKLDGDTENVHLAASLADYVVTENVPDFIPVQPRVAARWTPPYAVGG